MLILQPFLIFIPLPGYLLPLSSDRSALSLSLTLLLIADIAILHFTLFISLTHFQFASTFQYVPLSSIFLSPLIPSLMP